MVQDMVGQLLEIERRLSKISLCQTSIMAQKIVGTWKHRSNMCLYLSKHNVHEELEASESEPLGRLSGPPHPLQIYIMSHPKLHAPITTEIRQSLARPALFTSVALYQQVLVDGLQPIIGV